MVTFKRNCATLCLQSLLHVILSTSAPPASFALLYLESRPSPKFRLPNWIVCHSSLLRINHRGLNLQEYFTSLRVSFHPLRLYIAWPYLLVPTRNTIFTNIHYFSSTISSMAAISLPRQANSDTLHHLAKRNWAGDNPGVILVFCIVFIIGCGIIALFLYRQWMARKAVKTAYPVEE